MGFLKKEWGFLKKGRVEGGFEERVRGFFLKKGGCVF